MADYGKTHKVIVDIITLDSEACAPCQYMVEAVRAVTPEFEGLVEWREHKIKKAESLVFMTSLMVKNIPTICIDGQITFVSRIPKKEELIGAIRRRIYEKLRMKIRYRHATLYVLGDGGEAFQEALSRTQRAVAEMGAEVQIEQVTSQTEILSYGVDPSQTPAVGLARYQVKSAGTPPETAIIKEWIKDALL
jgi:uroporphyrinogen decarboxylase